MPEMKLAGTVVTDGTKTMKMSSEDLMHNFTVALTAQIEDVDKTLMPLLKVYINSVRDIRMALGREVVDIIRTSQELMQLTKYNKELSEFTKTVLILREVLTPELMEKLRRLTAGMEE